MKTLEDIKTAIEVNPSTLFKVSEICHLWAEIDAYFSDLWRDRVIGIQPISGHVLIMPHIGSTQQIKRYAKANNISAKKLEKIQTNAFWLDQI